MAEACVTDTICTPRFSLPHAIIHNFYFLPLSVLSFLPNASLAYDPHRVPAASLVEPRQTQLASIVELSNWTSSPSAQVYVVVVLLLSSATVDLCHIEFDFCYGLACFRLWPSGCHERYPPEGAVSAEVKVYDGHGRGRPHSEVRHVPRALSILFKRRRYRFWLR